MNDEAKKATEFERYLWGIINDTSGEYSFSCKNGIVKPIIEKFKNFQSAIDASREADKKRVEGLKAWVNDLQSGMYINCVYCGYRYGPKGNTPVAIADVLKEHIEQCPEHPCSKLKQRIKELEGVLELSNAKVVWLDNIYATLLSCGHHLAPKYPGDDKVLELFRVS